MSKKGRPRRGAAPEGQPPESQELLSSKRVEDTNSERQKSTRHKKVSVAGRDAISAPGDIALHVLFEYGHVCSPALEAP